MIRPGTLAELRQTFELVRKGAPVGRTALLPQGA